MKLLSQQELVDEVRAKFNKITKRLWVASPFIGDWESVRRILGREWMDNSDIDVRLITDDANINAKAYKTVEHFQRRGTVKTLKALHAKIYIVDNHAIVTSANLTGTAFFCRYEAGVLLSDSDAKYVNELYCLWWKKASDFRTDFMPRVSGKRKTAVNEEISGKKLPRIWNVPDDPGDPYAGLTSEFSDYPKYLDYYREFAKSYSRIQRVWPETPLYFETDAFLNYLFHDAPKKPSREYEKKKPLLIDATDRKKEIRRYATMFKQSKTANNRYDRRIRSERSQIIRNKLNEARIKEINMNDVEEIINCLNCQRAYLWHKAKFLGFANENLELIRKTWKTLIHGKKPLELRMSECKRTLAGMRFGKSSIQELIGFYYPKKYPLRNRNSNAGLRFFGYDVAIY
jgi:hypothetical protein